MAKKETKAKGKYYRKKVRHPVTGEYKDVYGKSRAERDEKADALEAAWAREIEDAESPYFWQYAADWFARVSGDMKPQRRADVAREINKNICPVIGEKKLREITSDDVLDVMAARNGLSRSTQTKTLQVLKRILAAAARAGKLEKDPTEDIKAGGAKPAKRFALTKEQETALLEAVSGLRIEIFVLLGLYAGLRREEICGLQWKDVHLDAPAPYIDVRKACRWPQKTQAVVEEILKGDASWRTLSIPNALRDPLTAARDKLAPLEEGDIRTRHVVGNADGSPWSYTSLRRAWDGITARTAGPVTRRRKDPKTGKLEAITVVKKLGDVVPKHPGVVVSLDFDVTPHLLRYTYITRLILGGVDLKRVQYLAGHSSAQITLDIYTSIMGHQPEDMIDDIRAIFDD